MNNNMQQPMQTQQIDTRTVAYLTRSDCQGCRNSKKEEREAWSTGTQQNPTNDFWWKTPDDYVDFHLAIEEAIRKEQ